MSAEDKLNDEQKEGLSLVRGRGGPASANPVTLVGGRGKPNLPTLVRPGSLLPPPGLPSLNSRSGSRSGLRSADFPKVPTGDLVPARPFAQISNPFSPDESIQSELRVGTRADSSPVDSQSLLYVGSWPELSLQLPNSDLQPPPPMDPSTGPDFSDSDSSTARFPLEARDAPEGKQEGRPATVEAARGDEEGGHDSGPGHPLPLGRKSTMSFRVATKTRECIGLFKELGSASASLTDANRRLLLWSRNIGAHLKEPGSLDERLRDSHRIRDIVLACLESLRDALLTVKAGYPRTADERMTERSPERQPEEDPLQASVFGALVVEDPVSHIRDIIDTLYHLTVAIRTPSSVDRFKNAQTVELRDIASYRALDAEYLDTNFQRLDKTLRQRLLDGMLQRRRFLEYSNHHHNALAYMYDIEPFGESAAQKEMNAALENIDESYARTEVSHFPSDQSVQAKYTAVGDELAGKRYEGVAADSASEASSVYSTSSFTSMAPTQHLSTPQLPPGPSPYECPCCYLLVEVKNKKSWEKHILQDLRPYVCTFPDCSQSESLFARESAWHDHEVAFHQRQWQCIPECGQSFDTEEKGRVHFQTHDRDIAQMPALPTGSSGARVGLPCPFCGKKFASRQRAMKHVAKHQEQVALVAFWGMRGLIGEPEGEPLDSSDEAPEEIAEEPEASDASLPAPNTKAMRIMVSHLLPSTSLGGTEVACVVDLRSTWGGNHISRNLYSVLQGYPSPRNSASDAPICSLYWTLPSSNALRHGDWHEDVFYLMEESDAKLLQSDLVIGNKETVQRLFSMDGKQSPPENASEIPAPKPTPPEPIPRADGSASLGNIRSWPTRTLFPTARQKVWFLLPMYLLSPDSVQLGSIIAFPREPQSMLSRGVEHLVPNDIYYDLQEDFQMQWSKESAANPAILDLFLSKILKDRYTIREDMANEYELEAKVLRRAYFTPSQSFVEERLKDPDIKQHLAAGKRPVYMITGIMIAENLEVRQVQTSTVSGSAGGSSSSLAGSRQETRRQLQSVHKVSVPVLLSYSLSQITVKSGSRIVARPYTNGALL